MKIENNQSGNNMSANTNLKSGGTGLKEVPLSWYPENKTGYQCPPWKATAKPIIKLDKTSNPAS